MSLNPVYCSQCGKRVEYREIEERMRAFCPGCGTIHYRNPLPVASALVLNSRREVLLVRRKNDPRKGLWCLPIGFAELGESIAHAALRELHEEAGIRGRVTRLLHARSMEVETYGELLVVTFEVVKTGGEERAGDDAEDVGYFPLDSLPPLAFEPIESAIRYSAEAHREEWDIQDSFNKIDSDDHQLMLSDTLVAYIRDNAEKIADIWLNEVCVNPMTYSYSIVQKDHLKDRVRTAISHFTEWLSGPEYIEEVGNFFNALGEERREMGFSLHEVIYSLNLLRKYILNYAHEHDLWDRPIEAYRVLEFDRRIMLFFDEVIYHTSVGYSMDEDEN